MLTSLNGSGAHVLAETASAIPHSSTSDSSLNNTTLPYNNLLLSESSKSTLDYATSISHRRRAKILGGPTLICAVCGDVASWYSDFLAFYFNYTVKLCLIEIIFKTLSK